MNAAVPVIRANGEGDKQSFLGGGLHTWKLMAEDTDGAFFLFEDALSEGKTTPLHRTPMRPSTSSKARSSSTSTATKVESVPAAYRSCPEASRTPFLWSQTEHDYSPSRRPASDRSSTAARASPRPTTPPTGSTSHASKR